MEWLPAKYTEAYGKFSEYFNAAESKYGLPSGILARLAYQESRFNPNALSPVGAIGLMQFMPATARMFGIDPKDPVQSISASARFLKDNYNSLKSWPLALAAYNWGPGNIAKYKDSPDKWPMETKKYVAEISHDVGLPLTGQLAYLDKKGVFYA